MDESTLIEDVSTVPDDGRQDGVRLALRIVVPLLAVGLLVYAVWPGQANDRVNAIGPELDETANSTSTTTTTVTAPSAPAPAPIEVPGTTAPVAVPLGGGDATDSTAVVAVPIDDSSEADALGGLADDADPLGLVTSTTTGPGSVPVDGRDPAPTGAPTTAGPAAAETPSTATDAVPPQSPTTASAGPTVTSAPTRPAPSPSITAGPGPGPTPVPTTATTPTGPAQTTTATTTTTRPTPTTAPTTTTTATTTVTRPTPTTTPPTTTATTTTTRPTTVTTASTTTTTTAPATSTTTTTQPATSTTTTTQPPTTTTTTQPPTTTTTAPPNPGTCASGGEFERLLRDDFNGSSLGSHWSPYYSAGNAGYGLRRPSAISVQNGRMVITARMENGSLVSGGMEHLYNQQYGKYRFRVRTDNDPSRSLSGVVLTWPQSDAHPRDGENNIYETLVQTANRDPFFTFIHKPYGTTHDQEYYEHHADGSQFQVMTMEWTPDRITITREGPGRDGNWDSWTVNETSADLIPDNPHKLTIQLDAWQHSMTGTVRMEVDWVEVYRYCG
ncbi:MAG: glycoside hydrolase family 16 protein [Actinomycetota bacterium]